VTINW
jgi:hypothetical protein